MCNKVFFPWKVALCVSLSQLMLPQEDTDDRLQDILTSPHIFKWLFEGEDLVLKVKLRVGFWVKHSGVKVQLG